MAETYRITLTRGKEKKMFDVPCTGEYIRRIVNKVFRGRFSKPEKLNVKDGVKLIVSGGGKVLIGRRIYNKSVFQVMTALEKAIVNTPA
jgi:hypothetical protein